jgi:uncharacterized phage protein (TIGR01671 family)
MREIKFRAWCNGKMLNDNEIIIVNGTAREYNHGDLTGFSESHLMQYTGLKDKNGVEIYEGDILKPKSYHPISEIFFMNGSWKVQGRYSKIGVGSWANQTEVIGNIYQNQELLEK